MLSCFIMSASYVFEFLNYAAQSLNVLRFRPVYFLMFLSMVKIAYVR